MIPPHLSRQKRDIFSRKGRRINEISKAIRTLRSGGVVVYPTDTAYGLAVDATNAGAVRKLYRLKGRNFKKPVHVICPHQYYHTSYDDSICPVRLNQVAVKLMRKFWPGPLTIVLPLRAKGESWQMLSAGTGTLGIRYPNHPTAQALVEAFKKPITTTSANISGSKNAYSVVEVKKQFKKAKFRPDFYLDGGRLKPTKSSTVVILTGKNAKILRPGPISETEIKKALKY